MTKHQQSEIRLSVGHWDLVIGTPFLVVPVVPLWFNSGFFNPAPPRDKTMRERDGWRSLQNA